MKIILRLFGIFVGFVENPFTICHHLYDWSFTFLYLSGSFFVSRNLIPDMLYDYQASFLDWFEFWTTHREFFENKINGGWVFLFFLGFFFKALPFFGRGLSMKLVGKMGAAWFLWRLQDHHRDACEDLWPRNRLEGPWLPERGFEGIWLPPSRSIQTGRHGLYCKMEDGRTSFRTWPPQLPTNPLLDRNRYLPALQEPSIQVSHKTSWLFFRMWYLLCTDQSLLSLYVHPCPAVSFPTINQTVKMELRALLPIS